MKTYSCSKEREVVKLSKLVIPTITMDTKLLRKDNKDTSSSSHSDEGIFSFDDEDSHFHNNNSSSSSSLGGLKRSKTVPINLSALPDNWANEEIITLVPKNNFSFDILDTKNIIANNNNLYNTNNNNNNIWDYNCWKKCGEDSADQTTSGSDLVTMTQNMSIRRSSMDEEQQQQQPAPFSPSSPDCKYCGDFYGEDHWTIEGLRVQLHSCFTCGVHWREEHVSLDCRECGGYALARPCPSCDGSCPNVWTRNLSETHSLGRAKWVGVCSKNSSSSSSLTNSP